MTWFDWTLGGLAVAGATFFGVRTAAMRSRARVEEARAHASRQRRAEALKWKYDPRPRGDVMHRFSGQLEGGAPWELRWERHASDEAHAAKPVPRLVWVAPGFATPRTEFVITGKRGFVAMDLAQRDDAVQTGSEAWRNIWRVVAKDPQTVAPLVDGVVERLMLKWPMLERGVFKPARDVKLTRDAGGLRIECSSAPDDTRLAEHVVRLGTAIARRLPVAPGAVRAAPADPARA